jgi:hypothetical protein
MRAAKNLTWNACGRAGEIAKADCKEHLSYDRYFRKLRMDWTQVKTGKLKVVFFTAHATSYVVCAVNSLFCHLVVNGHAVTKGNFLFPELCDAGQPSQRMTKLWKDFYDDESNVFSQYAPEGLTAGIGRACLCKYPENHSAQGDRIGVSNMVSNADEHGLGMSAATQIGKRGVVEGVVWGGSR